MELVGRDEVSFDEVLQNFTIAFTNGTKSTRANQDPDVLQTLVEQSEPQVTKIIADFETIDQTMMFFSEVNVLDSLVNQELSCLPLDSVYCSAT